jgi:hypothetical protein
MDVDIAILIVVNLRWAPHIDAVREESALIAQAAVINSLLAAIEQLLSEGIPIAQTPDRRIVESGVIA